MIAVLTPSHTGTAVCCKEEEVEWGKIGTEQTDKEIGQVSTK